jgi:thioesterase domain-containing protein
MTLTTHVQPEDESADLCLVPFHENGRPELYYIHEMTGSVVRFVPVAGRLSPLRDIVGIQSLGLDPDHPADPTIEEMAERYARILSERDAAQPCELIGFSMGGLIALEVAARLLQRGVPVRLVGLIDPPVPGSLVEVDPAWTLRGIAEGLGVATLEEAETDDVEQLIELLLDGARAAGTLPSTFTMQDMHRTLDLHRVNRRAAVDYLPAQPLPMDVRLLGAGVSELDRKLAGWAPFVAGRIRGEAVEADHATILAGPNAATVSAILERWLREADEEWQRAGGGPRSLL